MKVRTTKSNLTTSKETAKEEDCPNYDEDDENVDPYDEGQNEEETRENVDSSEESILFYEKIFFSCLAIT